MERSQKGLALIRQPAEKGFTLIELLVVIAILGVLAAGVVVAINPAKRIKQANDAKLKNDIGQIATAFEAYYTASSNLAAPMTYPASVAAISGPTGELKMEPKIPPGGTVSYSVALTAAPNCTDTNSLTLCEAAVFAPLNDPKSGTNVWCWQSLTGKTCEVATGTCTANGVVICL